MTVAHLLRAHIGKPIADDIRRAERLLAGGDAQAAALVAAVALERRLRAVRPIYAWRGLRAAALSLRAEGIINRKQSIRLRWIAAQRNGLVHGRLTSDVAAEALVRQIVAFVREVEGSLAHA